MEKEYRRGLYKQKELNTAVFGIMNIVNEC